MMIVERALATPLTNDELRKMDAYWRASHYLSVDRSVRRPKATMCNRLSENLSTTALPGRRRFTFSQARRPGRAVVQRSIGFWTTSP